MHFAPSPASRLTTSQHHHHYCKLNTPPTITTTISCHLFLIFSTILLFTPITCILLNISSLSCTSRPAAPNMALHALAVSRHKPPDHLQTPTKPHPFPLSALDHSTHFKPRFILPLIDFPRT
ncbi:hypothetical protein E2C01_092101 [Portunus trituberculatus]|uniref:Uncharacterized protein n=1 Tax=Portunus trituberculatus TaxID=210409 RepID=A0A5B7JKQ0_PORTR|nr:hypothetical protein [Portunus trituberculatus]